MQSLGEQRAPESSSHSPSTVCRWSKCRALKQKGLLEKCMELPEWREGGPAVLCVSTLRSAVLKSGQLTGRGSDRMEVKRTIVQTRSCKARPKARAVRVGRSETATERTPTEYAEVRHGEAQDRGILSAGPSWAT